MSKPRREGKVQERSASFLIHCNYQSGRWWWHRGSRVMVAKVMSSKYTVPCVHSQLWSIQLSGYFLYHQTSSSTYWYHHLLESLTSPFYPFSNSQRWAVESKTNWYEYDELDEYSFAAYYRENSKALRLFKIHTRNRGVRGKLSMSKCHDIMMLPLRF